MKNIKPAIRYFLYRPSSPVLENDAVWKTPLPMNRNNSQKRGDISVSHGEYFQCIRSFLERDGFELPASAISRQTVQNVKPENIETIDIYTEKHGEFYHPARIEIAVHGSIVSFVLNVAISEAGKACIRREYDILKQLNNNALFLPRVYRQGNVFIKDGFEARMFLGEWFKGYHEFHISRDRTDETYKTVVWDSEKGHFFLSPDQMAELYIQAAKILTTYYNVETFEQIWPWHHAAGDFIIRCHNNNDIELKLVTARQYQALLNNKDRDANSILDALLMFLINLSIRTRLDRLDGTGDVVWADDIAVLGTLDGFFQALASKSPIPQLPAPISDCFRYYLSQVTESDLYEWGEAVLDAYHHKAPEVPVIQKYMKQHTAILYHHLSEVCKD